VLLGLLATAWLDHRLRQAGRPDLAGSNATAIAYLLAAVTLVIVLGIPVGGWSLVVRFRRARGVERQQLRWLAFAATLVAVGVAVMVVLIATGHEAPVGWISGGCLALLPAATGAAILRYRLYDLDRIISRTLVYGLLTALLGGALLAGRSRGRPRPWPGLAPCRRRGDPGGGGRPAWTAHRRPAGPRRPDDAADTGVTVAVAGRSAGSLHHGHQPPSTATT
jgi:hypothetical protein